LSFANFPRLLKMKNKAIFADTLSDWDDLKQAHEKGANVLFGHGGAEWVNQDVFWDNLKQCNPDFGANPLHNDLMLKTTGTWPNNIAELAGVWVGLDKLGPAPLTPAAPPPR
jgi:hypothetical protein